MIQFFTRIFKESHFSFDGKGDNEIVHIFLYQHWITLIAPLFGMAAFLVFPVIPLFFLSGFIAEYNLEGIVLFLVVVFYMFMWSSAFFTITMYLLDTWIVTSNRIIDTKQNGFFSRTISEMTLSRVQDISVKTEGFMQTIFSYGDVEIQTAGTVDKFVFKRVPHPNQVKDKIMHLVSRK
jgi:uncharacterized membrane protein YdbT with pleckstrin-like domain